MTPRSSVRKWCILALLPLLAAAPLPFSPFSSSASALTTEVSGAGEHSGPGSAPDKGAARRAVALPPQCLDAIDGVLDVRAEPGDLVTPENAQAIHDLEALFRLPDGRRHDLLRGLSDGDFERCRRYAARLFRKAWEEFGRTLERSLDSSARAFLRDLTTLIGPWEENQRWVLLNSASIRRPVIRYAAQTYEQVADEVRRIKSEIEAENRFRQDGRARTETWTRWLARKPSFSPWSAEWTRRLGRSAPAAVELITAEIAVLPYWLDPEDFALIVFHEVAHLADPGFLEGRPLSDNEAFAWQMTLEFITERERRLGIPPSPFASSVREAIDRHGMNEWVRRIFNARGWHAH